VRPEFCKWLEINKTFFEVKGPRGVQQLQESLLGSDFGAVREEEAEAERETEGGKGFGQKLTKERKGGV
jgi:hypothetical protein